MTAQSDLHELVDRLADEEAKLLLEALQTHDPMLLGMALADRRRAKLAGGGSRCRRSVAGV